jgi:hypothetical protein
MKYVIPQRREGRNSGQTHEALTSLQKENQNLNHPINFIGQGQRLPESMVSSRESHAKVLKGNVGVTTCRWCETNHLPDNTTSDASPSQPLTDVRVNVKTPLDRNWYPRSGIVEDLWVCDTRHAQYTRLFLGKGYSPIRVCNIVSPSSASTSFDPLCVVQTMSGCSRTRLKERT